MYSRPLAQPETHAKALSTREYYSDQTPQMEKINDSSSPYATRPDLSTFKKIHKKDTSDCHASQSSKPGRRVSIGIPHLKPIKRSSIVATMCKVGREDNQRPACDGVNPPENSETVAFNPDPAVSVGIVISQATGHIKHGGGPSAVAAASVVSRSGDKQQSKGSKHRRSRYHRRTLLLPQIEAVAGEKAKGGRGHELNVDDLPGIRKRVEKT